MGNLTLRDACSSYEPNSSFCKDGFIQKPFCSGRGACHACGSYSQESLPYCLSDELPLHFIKNNGSPIFYRVQVPDDAAASSPPARA